MKYITFFFFAGLLFFFSCDQRSEMTASESVSHFMELDLKSAPPADFTERRKQEVKTTERKVIKTGEISFETDDPEETKKFLLQLIDEMNGYITRETQNTSSGNMYHTIVVRIPSSGFDKFLNKLAGNVGEFDRKDITAKDVTEEYIDIEARIRTKKELEEKYLQLLKKADNVKDILEIERQIGTLREEIEAVEGRLNFLKDQIAYSTLTIRYYKDVPKGPGLGKELKDGLVNGWDLLLRVLVGLVNLWPFVLILVLVIVFIVRRRKAKKV